MASVMKRGKSYRIRVSCGYDINGKQVFQMKTWTPEEGMTSAQIKKELQRQTVLFEEECASGQVVAAIKFQRLCEQWFKEYAELNHRSTTLQREHLIASRIYPALGHLRIDKITARDIQKFINSLSKPGANKNNGKPLSQKTMRHHLSFISSVFEYANQLDMISTNPCSKVKIPKQDVEEYIRRLKKYANVPELTREMCLELIEYITVDEYAADRPRDIHIYYKLLDKPLPNKMRLEINANDETA